MNDKELIEYLEPYLATIHVQTDDGIEIECAYDDEDIQEVIDAIQQHDSEKQLLINNMKNLIIDLHAALRAIDNTSSAVVEQCNEERKRLSI